MTKKKVELSPYWAGHAKGLTEYHQKIQTILDRAEKERSQIYEELKTGTSDRWYEARVAFDLLEQTLFELRNLIKDQKES